MRCSITLNWNVAKRLRESYMDLVFVADTGCPCKTDFLINVFALKVLIKIDGFFGILRITCDPFIADGYIRTASEWPCSSGCYYNNRVVGNIWCILKVYNYILEGCDAYVGMQSIGESRLTRFENWPAFTLQSSILRASTLISLCGPPVK